MNGIEKITARIEAEASADADRLAAETAARCETVRAEGEARAQEAYWRRLQEGVKAAEDRADRLAKAADMEARKSVLASKQTIVASIFDAAEAKLRALSGGEYVDFLAGQAARASSSGTEELILSAADREALGAKVLKAANERLAAAGKPAKLVLSPESGDFTRGLILRDGNITVNCTVEALMAQAREEQASAVAAELFA